MQIAHQKRPVSGRRLQQGLLLLILGAATACASPRDRITIKLTEAGLEPEAARCVADRMVDNLSTAQLRRIADAARPGRYGRLTVGELAGRLSEVSDPQITRVLTEAGISCVVLG